MVFMVLQDTRYVQYITTVAASMAMASSGMFITWTSPALPKLMSENSPIGTIITPQEGSWVASSLILGTVFGSLIVSMYVNRFGRKTLMLSGIMPVISAWLIFIFARASWHLVIGRLLAGFAYAAITAGSSMYIGEVVDKDIRGKQGTTISVIKLCGRVYVLILGTLLSYTQLAISCMIFPILFLLLYTLMPESPYYLVQTNNLDRALKALRKLSRVTEDNAVIENRLAEIKRNVEYDMQNKTTFWELITKKDHRRALIAIIVIRTMQQMSGIAAIEGYLETIFMEGNTVVSAGFSAALCGMLELPGVLISAMVVDKVGRKPLLIISSIGCSVCLLLQGLFFYMLHSGHTITPFQFLPTCALMVYMFMYSLGLMPLNYVYLSELFALNVKGIASTAALIYGGTWAYLVMHFFEPLVHGLGFHVVFVGYGVMCFVFGVISCFLVPETKGKSLVEIQKDLNPNMDSKL